MVTANETRSLSELEDSDPRRFALQPGRNCWRAGIANRATALVDGAAYFAALETAMQRAERQLFVVGWDVHAHAVGEETVQEESCISSPIRSRRHAVPRGQRPPKRSPRPAKLARAWWAGRYRVE